MKRLSVWEQFKEFFKDLFLEEYELTIWFHGKTTTSNGGLKIDEHTNPKVFYLKRIDKISQTHIKGTDERNNPFEIKTSKPFDYNLKKLS